MFLIIPHFKRQLSRLGYYIKHKVYLRSKSTKESITFITVKRILKNLYVEKQQNQTVLQLSFYNYIKSHLLLLLF